MCTSRLRGEPLMTMYILFCSYRYDYDPERFAGNQIPILVIGTKTDQVQTVRELPLSRASPIAEECNADEINLDCNQVKFLAPGSSNAVKLSRFFDRVIQYRFYNRESNQNLTAQASLQDRKRNVFTQYSKSSTHLD